MTRGKKKIIAQNNRTEGVITSVEKCWWIKINTKPVRSHSLDGAVFPEIIYFKYSVNDTEYNGHKFVGIRKKFESGQRIAVYFDENKPSRYAVED